MAKIPTFSDEPSVSREAPRARGRFQTAGLAGQALASVGRGVQNLAAGLLPLAQNLDKKRERAEITEFGDNSSRQYRREVEQFILDRKDQSSASNHDGYAASVNEFMKDRREELGKDSPSEEARDYYLRKTDAFVTNKLTDSDSYENVQRAKFNISNRVDSIDETSNSLFSNPDPFTGSKEMGIVEQELGLQIGEQFTKAQAEDLVDNARKKFRESTVSGMIRDGLPGIITPDMSRDQKVSEIQRLLDGNVEGTEKLFTNLDPKEKIRLSRRMTALVDNQAKSRNSETFALAKNASLILAEGGHMSPTMQDQVDVAFTRLQGLPDSPKKDVALKDFVNSKKVGDFVKQATYMSNSDLASTDVEDLIKENKLITSKVDKSAETKMLQGIQDLIKKRNDDGAQYIKDNYPNLASDSMKSTEMQRTLGITQPRVLTKDESRSASRSILDGFTARDRAFQLDLFVAKQGSLGGQAVAELVKDNPEFDKSYLFASFFNSTLTKEAILQNAGQKNKINTEFDKVRSGEKSIVTTETQAVASDALLALNRAGLVDISNGLRESIELHAKSKMLKDPNLDIDDAVEQASNEILGENFDVITEDSTSLLVPKELGVSKNTVSAFLEGSFSEEALKSYGLSPERYLFAGTEEEFFSSLEGNLFWGNSEGQDSAVLMMENPRTGMTGPLQDKNGSRIEFKYTDMKSDQRTLDNLNSFLGF